MPCKGKHQTWLSHMFEKKENLVLILAKLIDYQGGDLSYQMIKGKNSVHLYFGRKIRRDLHEVTLF